MTMRQWRDDEDDDNKTMMRCWQWWWWNADKDDDDKMRKWQWNDEEMRKMMTIYNDEMMMMMMRCTRGLFWVGKCFHLLLWWISRHLGATWWPDLSYRKWCLAGWFTRHCRWWCHQNIWLAWGLESTTNSHRMLRDVRVSVWASPDLDPGLDSLGSYAECLWQVVARSLY